MCYPLKIIRLSVIPYTVFGSRLTAQVVWLGLRDGGHWRSVYIHHMNRVNSLSHDHRTTDIVLVIIIIITKNFNSKFSK